MENDDDMRRIMELILPNFLTHIRSKNFAPDLFISFDQQITDFLHNMKVVLSVKKILIYYRWEHFCEISCFEAVSTHEMYLRYVMFACDIEVRFYHNIFEKLLSAFALVMHFNNETLINSGVDFCELSVDIFMAFYKKTLKESFYNQGGFQQFAQYLNHHEYLPWRNYMHNNPETIHSIEKQSFLKKLFYKSEKEIGKIPYNPNSIKHSEVIENTICESLAREVLLTTKIQLPTLTNAADLNVRLQAARELKEKVRAAFLKLQTSCEVSKCEIAATTSKQESMVTPSPTKMTNTNLKCERTNVSLELGSINEDFELDSINEDFELDSINEDLKFEPINKNLEFETTNSDLELETTNSDLELETTNKDVELESIDKDMELESIDKDMELEPINEGLIHGATVKSLKSKTARPSSYKPITPFKREICKTASIRKASEEPVKSAMPEKISKQKSSGASKNKTEETVLQKCNNRESGSQTDSTVSQKAQIEWCESIVQKVVKYNNLKSSGPEDGNNKIFKEADEFLKQLKKSIKSLMDVLKDFDEE